MTGSWLVQARRPGLEEKKERSYWQFGLYHYHDHHLLPFIEQGSAECRLFAEAQAERCEFRCVALGVTNCDNCHEGQHIGPSVASVPEALGPGIWI